MAREPQRIKKRERKNISSGVAHVNASFNNTMVTITDAQGNTIALCRAGRRRRCRQKGLRTWRAHSGSRSEGPRFGPRKRAARLAGGGLYHHLDPRRDPDPAQWRAAVEAPPRLIELSRRAAFSRSAIPDRPRAAARTSAVRPPEYNLRGNP